MGFHRYSGNVFLSERRVIIYSRPYLRNSYKSFSIVQ